jgi:small GTP-binding protein
MMPRMIGVDFEKLTIDETSLLIWSIGGRSAHRPLWRQYHRRMSAYILVVDSNDHERIDEAREKLHQMVNDETYQEKPILIFANKQDLPNAMDCDQLRNKLNLEKLSKNIKWHLQPASAIQNQGLHEGFEWLMNSIREKNDSIKPIVETFNDAVIMKNDFISTFSMDKFTALIRKFISLSFYSIECVIKQTSFLK